MVEVIFARHYAEAVAWEILLHDNVDTWFLALCEADPETGNLVAAVIDKLAADGPALGLRCTGFDGGPETRQ